MTGDRTGSISWRPAEIYQAATSPGNAAPRNGVPDVRVPGMADRLTATFELMAALLEKADLADVLTLVVRRARLMADARLAFMALPGEAVATLTIDIADGVNADYVQGMTVRVGTSAIGRVFATRRALSARVATDPLLKGLPPGPILLLPLDTGERTCGVLALAGGPGDIPLSASIKRQLLIFATTSAALIELGEERRAVCRG
jgi:transcriptional regulator with GAF, ATPase, and Fis domain